MKRSMESLYQMRYYRKTAMDSLRREKKRLQDKIKQILDSPEGKAYSKRIKSEKQKEYQLKNKDKIRKYNKEYQKEYREKYGQI